MAGKLYTLGDEGSKVSPGRFPRDIFHTKVFMRRDRSYETDIALQYYTFYPLGSGNRGGELCHALPDEQRRFSGNGGNPAGAVRTAFLHQPAFSGGSGRPGEKNGYCKYVDWNVSDLLSVFRVSAASGASGSGCRDFLHDWNLEFGCDGAYFKCA